MEKHLHIPVLAVCGSAACFVLRLLQNRSGFEPDTGLPIPGAPISILLPVVLLLLAGVTLLLARPLPGEKDTAFPTFREHFSPCAGSAALVLGGLVLWILSGALGFLSAGETAVTASGLYFPAIRTSVKLDQLVHALTALSAICLLPAAAAVFPRKDRPEGKAALPSATVGNLILLPVIFLVLRLALAYREMSINASQQVYYVELLAMMSLILGLYRLSSFAFRCGSTRRFTLYTAAAVILCITTLADSAVLPLRLFFAGGAALMLGFLTSRLCAPMLPPESSAE